MTQEQASEYDHGIKVKTIGGDTLITLHGFFVGAVTGNKKSGYQTSMVLSFDRAELLNNGFENKDDAINEIVKLMIHEIGVTAGVRDDIRQEGPALMVGDDIVAMVAPSTKKPGWIRYTFPAKGEIIFGDAPTPKDALGAIKTLLKLHARYEEAA